jgi:hypothetical protein
MFTFSRTLHMKLVRLQVNHVCVSLSPCYRHVYVARIHDAVATGGSRLI